MIGSTVLYAGLVCFFAGSIMTIKPIQRLGVPTRPRALAVAFVGLLTMAGALAAPAFDSRVQASASQLDAFLPAWQFHEVHTQRVNAPPGQVFDAITKVRADEILLFRTLTWIRRGGRPVPPSIMNAGSTEPIITIATRGGFVMLADDRPREIVLGVIVARPRGARRPLTPDTFRQPWPPGYALAAMNFRVTPDGAGGSIVSTETRVFATGSRVRRVFAAYWRAIYPGSALIRRMWLRAIDHRATR